MPISKISDVSSTLKSGSEETKPRITIWIICLMSLHSNLPEAWIETDQSW